jgi:hypothetical protein
MIGYIVKNPKISNLYFIINVMPNNMKDRKISKIYMQVHPFLQWAPVSMRSINIGNSKNNGFKVL